MKTVTPKAVVQRSLKDKAFFSALIRDPKKALEKAGMRLPPKQMERLRRILRTRRARVTYDPIALIHHLQDCPDPWPRGWPRPW